MKIDHFSINNLLTNGLQSSRLDSYENWSCFNWESIEELPPELQAEWIWHLIVFQLRINSGIASRALGWIPMKLDHFSIENQLKTGLRSSRLDPYEFDHFSIRNQLKKRLQSSRLDPYENWVRLRIKVLHVFILLLIKQMKSIKMVKAWIWSLNQFLYVCFKHNEQY